MKKHAWKFLTVAIMLYVLPMAWLGEVSVQSVIHETIRNLYFHVTMWFGMFILLLIGVGHGVRFLQKGQLEDDLKSSVYTRVALLFGCIGIVTGMVWAKYTWGTFWTKDPQLNGALYTIFAYFAYFILRSLVQDPKKRGELSAAYGIFAFLLMVVLVLVLPRMSEVDSLHPGKGGNPGFGSFKDLKSSMRAVFWPAIIGWTLVGAWVASIEIKMRRKKNWV
jgi:heme exporter protein C